MEDFEQFLSHDPGVLWSVSPMLVVMLFGYAAVGTFATTSIFGKVRMTS